MGTSAAIASGPDNKIARKAPLISTYGWQQYSPPSIYEFVIYSLVVQSILIHLNANAGLPATAYRDSRHPRPYLTPKAEEVLLNSFVVEYLRPAGTSLRSTGCMPSASGRTSKKPFP